MSERDDLEALIEDYHELSVKEIADAILAAGWRAPVEYQQVRILYDGHVSMTPGKLAAQAVHAALYAYGIGHDRVVVLRGKKRHVLACDAVVADAGRTEVEPGTITCGATLSPVEP
jgi:PTH2 family peptidyl-tRNA hydrolase